MMQPTRTPSSPLSPRRPSPCIPLCSRRPWRD
jgi:hypothetical protein